MTDSNVNPDVVYASILILVISAPIVLSVFALSVFTNTLSPWVAIPIEWLWSGLLVYVAREIYKSSLVNEQQDEFAYELGRRMAISAQSSQVSQTVQVSHP